MGQGPGDSGRARLEPGKLGRRLDSLSRDLAECAGEGFGGTGRGKVPVGLCAWTRKGSSARVVAGLV